MGKKKGPHKQEDFTTLRVLRTTAHDYKVTAATLDEAIWEVADEALREYVKNHSITFPKKD